MFSLEIFLLGMALAMDAAVVSFAIGLLFEELPTNKKITQSLMIGSIFGIFQAVMLWVGSYGGYLISFSQYGHLFHLIVAMIFFIIAVKLIQESFENEKRDLKWGFLPVLLIAFATSIDALAAGMSLGTLPETHLASIEVGVITFIGCILFYLISQFFKKIPEKWLLRLASVIFIFLGIDVMWGISLKGIL